MSHSPDATSKNEQLLQIKEFVAKSTGLRSRSENTDGLHILQCADGKTLALAMKEVEEVIPRIDAEGQTFLQVNFHSGKKILLTAHQWQQEKKKDPHPEQGKRKTETLQEQRDAAGTGIVFCHEFTNIL